MTEGRARRADADTRSPSFVREEGISFPRRKERRRARGRARRREGEEEGETKGRKTRQRNSRCPSIASGSTHFDRDSSVRWSEEGNRSTLRIARVVATDRDEGTKGEGQGRGSRQGNRRDRREEGRAGGRTRSAITENALCVITAAALGCVLENKIRQTALGRSAWIAVPAVKLLLAADTPSQVKSRIPISGSENFRLAREAGGGRKLKEARRWWGG
ncbi:hypothetical protein KM043_002959 [Ampulex compressa]|nr:hypothetical protein KM043_002959 [Ampulex compressa]